MGQLGLPRVLRIGNLLGQHLPQNIGEGFLARPSFGIAGLAGFPLNGTILVGLPRGLAFLCIAFSSSAFLRDLRKRFIRSREHGVAAAELLPALYGDLDITGINIDCVYRTPVVSAAISVEPDPTNGS